jgi:hypothetical protein
VSNRRGCATVFRCPRKSAVCVCFSRPVIVEVGCKLSLAAGSPKLNITVIGASNCTLTSRLVYFYYIKRSSSPRNGLSRSQPFHDLALFTAGLVTLDATTCELFPPLSSLRDLNEFCRLEPSLVAGIRIVHTHMHAACPPV